MARLLSSWSKTAKSVPEEYVHPLGWRPEMDAPICKEIPVVDLSLAMVSDVHGRAKVADQIFEALNEYGAFQVINHGVSEKLMEDAMEVYKEFFNLPVEDKEKYVSNDLYSKKVVLYNGSDNPTEKIQFWRDSLHQYCYPNLEESIDSWPDTPARYREVIVEYVAGTKKVSQQILDVIAEGLGIEKEYFNGELTERVNLRANYYPKSPDPSLTTGVSVHHDPNIVTLIQQNVPGLHLLKDGKWLVVDPLPNAFVVLPGLELQIISNGTFKAQLHQVATNADVDRLSIGTFVSVNTETTIEPAKAFVSEENPPKYKSYTGQKYSEALQRKFLESEHQKLSAAAVYESALDSLLSHPTLK